MPGDPLFCVPPDTEKGGIEEQADRNRGLGNVGETYNDGLIPLCGLGVLIEFDAGEGAVAHLVVVKSVSAFRNFRVAGPDFVWRPPCWKKGSIANVRR